MRIYNVISDLENSKKLSFSLRNRILDQSLLYQNEGAQLYYKAIGHDEVFVKGKKEFLGVQDFVSFGNKNIFSLDENITLISLGCGRSYTENVLFRNQNNKRIKYIGIDSSQKMLLLSEKELKGINIDYSLLCADFSSDHFNELLTEFVEPENKRIFCFFSNTFGNINHTNIVDILYNILNRGEQIWLDVRLKKENSTSANMKIFNMHKLERKSTGMEKFFGKILEEAKIPLDNGFFSKKMENEVGINALKINFDFVFQKKTVVDVMGQITFLPKEHLSCLQIYYYDPESLIGFFFEHGFKLIDKQEKNMRGQFLFEKK